jgi:hypothetical protein
MLSKDQTDKVGIFDHESLSTIISRIEKSGNASEVDNMLLTSVISTHLLHYQFIENHPLLSGKLKNLKLVEDL